MPQRYRGDIHDLARLALTADWYALAGPLLRRLDAETAHGLAVRALAAGVVPRPAPAAYAAPAVDLWGLHFANPVGLAAGFDKNAQVADAMLAQGFGFVEVGTVTPRPQAGNPRPRLFRLPEDGAVINSMGFNNDGLDAVAARLAARRARPGIVGANVGPNKDSPDRIADCVAGVARLGPVADYLVVNVSSPNTPGLRTLQDPEPLRTLLAACLEARDGMAASCPLLLKIAPDLTDDDVAAVAEVATTAGIDGLIATNTTIARPPGLRGRHRGETGGLSGRPLRDPATAVLSRLYELTGGKLPLIGVGGIASAEDAYARIRAGASLVQLYTALVYHGPALAARIAHGLVPLLAADGFTTLAAAVGADHR